MRLALDESACLSVERRVLPRAWKGQETRQHEGRGWVGKISWDVTRAAFVQKAL